MGVISAALAVNAQESERVVIPFNCDVSASVGDLVYQDPSNDEKVIVLTDNTTVYQCIGIILTKSAATTANVLVLGLYEGYAGLSRGNPIFLSTSGTITTTKPASGYLHRLGVAVSSTKVLMIPNNVRTKLV